MPGQFAPLGAAIAAIRKAHDLRQWQFAESLGVSLVTVQMWEQGLKKPGVDKLLKLADMAPAQLVWELLKEIGIRPERARAWLPHAPMPTAPALIPSSEIRLITPENWKKFSGVGDQEKTYDVLPLFRDARAATSARGTDEKDIEGWAIIHRSMNRGHRPQDVVCVRVKGDSMEPVMPDGSIVAVDISRLQVTWHRPKPALVGFEGAVTVKLVRALPGGRLELRAYNETAWPSRQCSLDQAEIRGQVLWWWACAR